MFFELPDKKFRCAESAHYGSLFDAEFTAGEQFPGEIQPSLDQISCWCSVQEAAEKFIELPL